MPVPASYPSGVGPHRAAEDLHERALAGAVLAEEREHLAALEGEAGILRGAVALHHPEFRAE